MRLKQGVSMVVLAVTIIVMAILATTAIVYLEDTGIINKSKETVKDTNLVQVTELVKTAWNNANAKLNPTLEELQEAVNNALLINRIDMSEYNIIVTLDGVYVSRDFIPPAIINSSMAYTNDSVIVNIGLGGVGEEDYPLIVEYYIKPASITSEESYSLKKKALINSGVASNYTYTDLSSSTEYNIKVVVKDINGNSVLTNLNVTTQGTDTGTT